MSRDRQKQRERRKEELVARFDQLQQLRDVLLLSITVSPEKIAVELQNNQCPRCGNKLQYKWDTKEQDWCSRCDCAWTDKETQTILKGVEQVAGAP